MRKFVNVVALFVLVATNVFTPFSYAQYNTSGDINNAVQENEQVLDNAEDDVTLGEQGNENIRENNIDSIDDVLEGIGDDNQSFGPIISEEKVNSIESEENNDLEDSSFFGGFKETLKDLFGEENEEFNEDENIEKEIESKEIYGTGEYEGVKVEVYAQTGLFDNGTKLTIEPVVEEKLEAVQEVLLSSGNIELVEEDENKTVIAFDITYRDPVTDEEVQPKNGVVQVTFNYEENESLVQADENEEQEVKVYHLNDIDEEGNKIKELTGTVVEDVIINEEESEEDNVMVIEAESFSVYTIVVQVREEGINAVTENQLANFVYGEISIARPDSLSGDNNLLEGITIMDRNLGAIVTGAGADADSKSYGYHYQRGNNYGFDPNLTIDEIEIGNQQVDITGITGYYSSVFISGYESWMTGTYDEIFGLWGGELDSIENGWGVTGGVVINLKKRQGPCPDGWHVPSLGEWSLLFRYWGIVNDANPQLYDSNWGLYELRDYTKKDNFFSDLSLPYVSYRSYNNAVVAGGVYMKDYRSSSPYYRDPTSTSAGIVFLNYALPNGNYRSQGFPVRCFKDTYSGTGDTFTITYDFNGGSGSTASINVSSGGIVERPTDPIKSGYVFGGRFVQGTDTEYDFTEKVTGNVNLYAKWECNPGYAQILGDDGARNCFEYEELPALIGTEGKKYILMDRNLGATAPWDGTTRKTESNGNNESSMAAYYGYYYQWGNNWGFSAKTTAGQAGAVTVDSSYMPSKFSRDIWSTTQPWNSENNLWGDAYDTEEARQGPCPTNWHVPSSGEWQAIYNAWNSRSGHSENKGSTTKNFAYDLKLPPAGSRGNDNLTFYDRGSYGCYRSSSPSDDGSAYGLGFNSSGIYPQGIYGRSFGFPVRCLKNQPKVLTLDANGGTLTESEIEAGEDGNVTLPNATRESDSNGEWIFEGWFVSSGYSEKIGNSGDVINLTGDMTLYAHWAQTITILNPENSLSGFTIMDRNLGAVSNDINNTGSYGFHYQWGNNYGFKGECNMDTYECDTEVADSATGTLVPWNNSYNHSNFLNPIFIKGSSDYWEDGESHDGLWGGENDTQDNNRGLNIMSATSLNRQGPCPEDYHVPSIGEWNTLIEYWCKTNIDKCSMDDMLEYYDEGLYYSEYSDIVEGFSENFKLSLPGYRDYNDGEIDDYDYGYSTSYRSSTPYIDSDNSYLLGINLTSSDISISSQGGLPRSYGFPVRCFKNEYVAPITYTLTFDSQGGSVVATGIAVENDTWTRPTNPTKDGYTFVDWYTSTGYDTAFNFTGTHATENLKVYAKWERNCGEGEEYVESEDKCYPSRAIIRDSLTNEIIQINNQEWEDLELYILTGNGTLSHYTIMDRNMGASGVYNGNYKNPNSDSFGYYYQWGNNYGFSCGSLGCDEDHIGSSSVSTSQVEKNKWSSYIPSRWASNVFIYKTSWQKNPGIGDGLWGGTGDSLDANGNNTTPEGRQGPCPDGYHIPSTSEWNQMYQLWSGGVINSSSPILLAKNFLLPSAGQITLFEGYALGLGYLGRLAGCWSSSAPDSAYASMFDLYDGDSRGWDESEITPQESYSRGFGLPIRCSKNQSNSNSLTLHMGNANTKAVIGVLSGNNKLTVNSIESSISNGYVKWYGNENLDPSTEIVTGSDLTSIHDLYVSYNCNEGYAFSGSNELGGECVKQLTVTFNGNGGNITTGSIIVLSGSELDLSKYTATKPGWNFTGWNINSGAHEGLNNPLTVNSNITLYAIYTKEYTSNFVLKDSNAATLNETTASCIAYNTGYCTVTPPTLSAKNGYSVDGWSETNGGTETTSIFTGGITYYSVTHNNTPISITFYQNGNGGDGSEVRTCYKYNGSQTCKIKSPTITLVNGSSAIGWNTSPNYHSSSWNQNVERDVSYNELYYAQTQKLLTATFKSNDNKNYIDGNITDRTRTCYIYNNSTAGCTETTPKIQPRGENTPTVVGFTKSKEGVSTAEVGSNSTVRIYGGEVYYAHTKREKVDLTANWNGNNSTLGDTSLSEGCELPEVYDGVAQPTSCEVDAPSVTPNTNTPIFVGFNTGANATTNNSSYNSGTNKLTLTKNNSNNTWYAITYMSGKVLTIDYSIGTGVYSIGRNSDSCTLTGTYNGVAQSGSCTVKAPTITVSSGYLDNSKKWTDLSTSSEVEEGELITLTKDLHYTASAQYKSSAQPETYTITYELNGGIISGEKLVYTVEDDTFTLVRPIREHHIFVGWTGSNGLTPKLDVVIEHGTKYENLTYYANWYEDFNDNGINDATEDHFVVKYTDGVDGENVFKDQVFSGVLIGLATPSFIGTPSRNGYDFVGWEPNVSEFVLADIEYVAKWDKKSSGGGNSSGGGGKRFPTVDTHGSADEEKTEDSSVKEQEDISDSSEVENNMGNNSDNSEKQTQNDEEKVEETDYTSQYSEDFNQAYQFSKANGITTIDEIQNAKMYGNLTRIEMAKMLSNYAVNVIGRQPDVSKTIKFKDVSSKLDKQYDNGVTLAYQLGIMGQNMKNKKFRPNDKVTRAEFATALSRLLYQTPEGTNKSTKKYYEPHIAKLYNEGIITNTDPSMKEKRGYVMIMLMRSAGVK